MVNLLGSQATHSQDTLLMINLLVSEFGKIYFLAISMKENFLIIKWMVLVLLFEKMVTNSKETFLKEKNMDMVNLLLGMEG
jgi:hypothetical protein